MPLPKSRPMETAEGTRSVPSVGFGTWAEGDTNWCYKATLTALQAGYRHIDCAWSYGVDGQVGAALRDSQVPRNEVFITSKFWPHFSAPENVTKCLDMCLKNMDLDYLDLYLAHWPIALKPRDDIENAKGFPDATNKDLAILESPDGKPIVDWEHTTESIATANGKQGSFAPTWKAMQALVATGKVRSVGVSNFNISQLEEVLSIGGEIPLSCNQVEAHPWFQNTELLSFMRSKKILATVYCPFAGGNETGALLVKDPDVKRLAEKNKLGVGQLLQSWAVQRGTIPLGKSQTPERIRANLDVRELPLVDFEEINGMDRGESGRTVDIGSDFGVRFF